MSALLRRVLVRIRVENQTAVVCSVCNNLIGGTRPMAVPLRETLDHVLLLNPEHRSREQMKYGPHPQGP